MAIILIAVVLAVITGLNYFGKTNISNDVAGAFHPIGGRSGPDTVGLFTFLTLRDFQSFAK
jgi:ABC-type thiamin/hydroxymethylpyrimidine transport system permease subunit